MEAKECKVQDILTENKKFIIPSYQRPYSWTVDNAEQLIDDIYKSSQSEENEYFIGSMGNDSNLLIVFYVQIMPDDFVMQLHRF